MSAPYHGDVRADAERVQELSRRWVTPACQIEVVLATLETSIRAWLRAEKVQFEEGAGSRSSDAGVSAYFAMAEDDAARCRKFFAERLRAQRERFGLRDFVE